MSSSSSTTTLATHGSTNACTRTQHNCPLTVCVVTCMLCATSETPCHKLLAAGCTTMCSADMPITPKRFGQRPNAPRHTKLHITPSSSHESWHHTRLPISQAAATIHGVIPSCKSLKQQPQFMPMAGSGPTHVLAEFSMEPWRPHMASEASTTNRSYSI